MAHSPTEKRAEKQYAINNAQKKAVEIEVSGQPFRCTVCENNLFWMRRAQLNTAFLTFFNYDWLDKSATCYICSECGYIHWFHE